MNGDPGNSRSSPRASDSDRDAALGVLHNAMARGQLDPDEHEERVAAVLGSKTFEDLDRLTQDLIAPPTSTQEAAPSAPAAWYRDPELPGTQRYFDGARWTEHRAPLPVAPYGTQGWWAKPPWKGAALGRPAQGPGALADPARRLGARLLDGLVFLPVDAAMVALAVVLVAPHAGPIFPKVPAGSSAPMPTPGFVWIELAVFAAFAVAAMLMVAYETIATARYGRTLGKAWLHIRPIRTDGTKLGWGRSFGRVAIYWLASVFGWVGFLDPLWCLWDENRQCLHDKVACTIVVNDQSFPDPHGIIRGAGHDGQMPQWAQPGAVAVYQPYSLPSYEASPGYWSQPSAVSRTSSFAVASLVCSLVGILLIGIPAIPGIVFGFVARAQIHRSAGTRTGGGMALAGIIVGFVAVAFWTVSFTLSALHGTSYTS